MKEIIEFRIFKEHYDLLPKPNNAVYNGAIYILHITRDDDLYNKICQIDKMFRENYGNPFFLYTYTKRTYTKKELDNAKLFHLKIKPVFEPTGEECGTLYDETVACEICGTGGKQIGPLLLKKGTIPKKDIARTIGGEVVVSEKFVNAINLSNMKGLQITPTNVEKYYQLTANEELYLSKNTIAGDDPFTASVSSNGGTFNVSGHQVNFEKEVYICPKGDLLGLRLLSEPYVLNNQVISQCDFLTSKQKFGVKRGLLRPEPIYFCSQKFRKMVEEEKLTGFEFEIANIETE
ncbi:hypothetical protein [Chryseobacterium indologenes]|uniref:Uncharacterized protein n=1 Tax=Chryseobacterium indologenes TaxID=253 RepID=A0A0N0ZS22_CHRID|nr:hypothetical protein [Chryseobacterium indologenes]KPE49088.1 hypothetical protein AOB46_21840 [Chryseobacterium indologenes]